MRIARKRVARLMRASALAGVSRRRSRPVTTRRDPQRPPAHDLVRRNFVAERPNVLWVADITFVPTAAGFLFVAVVPDAWSRTIVGRAFSADRKRRLVLDALDVALEVDRPQSVIHHSDPGSPYTSLAFEARCRAAGVRTSTGSVGDASDNVMGERFFATLQCECLDRHRFRSHAEARIAVFHFIGAGTTRHAGPRRSAVSLQPNSRSGHKPVRSHLSPDPSIGAGQLQGGNHPISFRRFGQARHPPRYAAFLGPAHPAFRHSARDRRLRNRCGEGKAGP